MKATLVSVIVPVYNSEAYIEECLNSILCQTHENIEIICVDDGSTDNSLILLNRYREEDSRVKVISQANTGVSGARNRGIKVAEGNYITFVDSDDTIEPQMYEILIRAMDEYNADITHCSYKKVDADGTQRNIGDTGEIMIQQPEEAIRYLLLGKCFTGSPCNKLYRSSIVKEIKFNEEYRINEDVLFNFESFRKSEHIVFIDKSLYHYYERIASVCSTTTGVDKSIDCSAIAKIIYDNCKNTTLEEVAIYRYYMMLMNEYRYCLLDMSEANSGFMNELRTELLKIKEMLGNLSVKQRINLQLMLTFPRLYKFMYSRYNCLRKPNWDVN